MGILGKLFGKKGHDQRTQLEATLDKLTPGFMREQSHKLPNDLKVPYAQAMSVLLFAQLFARSLRTLARELPESARPERPYPYDAVLVEAAAFYYFSLMAQFQHDDDDLDEDADESIDPYFATLRRSLHLCAKIVSEISNTPRFRTLMPAHVTAYRSTSSGMVSSVTEKLTDFILRAWNPEKNARPSLELAGFALSVQACLGTTSVAQVSESCRGLYDEKCRNPNAF